MLLGIGERLMLLKLLALAEGNVATLLVVRDLQKRIGFSKKEDAVLDFHQKEGRIEWKKTADKSKEIKFSAREKQIIASQFRRLDAAEALTLSQFALYETFVGKVEAPPDDSLRE